jgi:hypothetical protein
VIRTAYLQRSGAATIQALEELREAPAGGNDGCLKFPPTVTRDGIGIEDHDGHD